MTSSPSSCVPPDLRARLEAARLASLALIRALDRLVPVVPEPCRQPLEALFELDADCAEAFWALAQPRGTLDERAMVRDTLASLDRLAPTHSRVRKAFPARQQAALASLERDVRADLRPGDAYRDIPGGDHHFR